MAPPEAVHVARHLNSAFQEILHTRVVELPDYTSFLLCGLLLVPRGLSRVAAVVGAGDVKVLAVQVLLFHLPCVVCSLQRSP